MDLIEAFDEDLELRGMAFETRKTYRHMVMQFSRHLGCPLQEASRQDLRDWLHELRLNRHLKASSLQMHFAALSSFYDFLQDEGIIEANSVPAFRKRNLRTYKAQKEQAQKKIITIEEAACLVKGIVDSRDRAIVLLLLKTGMRRHELSELDVSDLDLSGMSLRLKETPKRTNRTLFFDGETLDALTWWLETRENIPYQCPALFISGKGLRLAPARISSIVEDYALKAGLSIMGGKPEEKFTAHCTRHWFTTHLRRAGMPREFIQELRGDVRREAIDIYDHIDRKELRESYLAHIPQLGI